MNRMPAFLDQAEFAEVVAGRASKATLVPAPAGGWHLVVRSGASEAMLASQRGKPRHFARAETAIAYVQTLGVATLAVSVKGFVAGKTSERARPDRAAALKRAHKAAEYDRWYREQVQIGLDELDAGLGEPAEIVFPRLRARLKATLEAQKAANKAK